MLERELEGPTASPNVQRVYSYDALSRPVATSSLIDGQTYQQAQTYDAFGRPAQTFDLVFPIGDANAVSASQARQLGVQYEYGSRGYQVAIRNAVDSASDEFYRVEAMDARGNVTQSRRANLAGMGTTASYDLTTGRLTGVVTGSGSIQNWSYGDYDKVGNLGYRQSALSLQGVPTTLKESFGYDSLYRLTGSTRYVNDNLVSSASFSYDRLGNFLVKDGMTQRSRFYEGAPPQNCARTEAGPHAVVSAKIGEAPATLYCYDANGNQIQVRISPHRDR